MTRRRWTRWLAFVSLVTGRLVLAQGAPAKNPAANNPHLGNQLSIRSGMALYRISCADCHGLDASGYRGPDLIAVMAAGATDERLFQTIRRGMPGTDMPAAREVDTPDDDLLMIIAYLRRIGSVAPTEKPVGNIENGRRLFAAQCASCHARPSRRCTVGHRRPPAPASRTPCSPRCRHRRR